MALTDFITLTGPGNAFYQGDEVALRAQAQLTTLYNVLAARPTSVGGNLSGQDLGTFNAMNPLGPGVYEFNSSAQLTGTLVLDGLNDPDSVFVFKIGSTLTTASGANVVLLNGATGDNVFFQVGSTATLDTSTTFNGQIVALTAINLLTSTTVPCGAVLARNAAVTLDTNTIGICVVEGVAGEIDDILEDAETPPSDTAQDVADALEDYIAQYGPLPPGFAILAALLTPEELADALEQLAGQIGGSVAPVVRDSTDGFLTLVTGGRGGPGMAIAPMNPNQGQGNTVSALGYWPAPGTQFGAFNALSGDPGAAGSTTNFWLAGHGGMSLVEGDDDAGIHDRSAIDFGLAGGFDVHSGPAVIGVAAGWGSTRFELSDDLSSGSSDALQGAIHARVDGEAFYLKGGLAAAGLAITTDRIVTIAGEDHLHAEFNAVDFGAQAEAGYRLGILTPYVGVSGNAFFAPAYSETATEGVSTFALDYDAQTVLSARTEIGARLDWSTQFANGASLSLATGAAWAHDFRSDNSIGASLQALQGSSLTISGADTARDSLLLDAGVEIAFDGGLAIGGSLDGEFSENAQAYGGSLALSYAW
jgi:uncharacterized protein with beta-barrel porin domain